MSFAHYLLQVNIYLIVFYGFYKLLLDRETYFTLNRIYLVMAGILSLSIPFIRLGWLTDQKVAQQVYASVSWEKVLQQATIVSENNNKLGWGTTLVYIYCIGVIFFLGKLLINLITVNKLINTAKVGSAFSFFNRKVIDQNLPLVSVIDIHEEAHIKQWHTADVLFFEMLGILTWINPIIYFYKKSIKNIHEFLADEQAAEYQGDKAEYAMLILSQSFGISPNRLTNGFFDKSLIKKRIFMLQKDRSKKIAVMKYGFLIPLFAILIVFSSATVRKNKKLIAITNQIPLEKPIQLVEDMVVQDQETEPISEKAIAKTEKNKEDFDIAESSSKSLDQNTVALTNPNLSNVDDNFAPKNEDLDDNKVYDFVSTDKQPEFPGGIKQFYEYLSKSIKYPKMAQENNIQGKVFLSFIVEKNGFLTDVKITRGLGSGCDEEALRVIGESPSWNPGLQNGNPIRVKYNINVNFNLSGNINKEPKSDLNKEEIKTVIGFRLNHKKVDPLVLVDNVNMDFKDLMKISPNKIASMVVLKSAFAILKYGEKATQGVILVQTKENLKDIVLR